MRLVGKTCENMCRKYNNQGGDMEKKSHTTEYSSLSAILIIEGILVGIAGAAAVLLYRVALSYAGKWLGRILLFIKGNPLRIAGWFVILILFATLVGWLIKWEPMIAGGGIPLVKKEINGTLSGRWKRILPAKIAGGFLCILGGLSLGRCGPSIQLGAMAGQGVSQALKRGKDEERCLMACGAGAGMAATFHAPLAGMIFTLEELYKGGSRQLFIPVLTSAVTADFIVSYILGPSPVFLFQLHDALPQSSYWMLLLLGILLGLSGAFYSWIMPKVQNACEKPKRLGQTGKLMTAFLLSGLLGLLMPSVLGGGSELIDSLTSGKLFLGAALLALMVKFLFSVVCLGSEAPGGNIFPILTLGALLGGIFAMTCVKVFGFDPVYINNFVLLAMAGYFAAVLRTPVTAIVLLFEMSGLVSQMLSLSIVCLTAYVVAEWIYPGQTAKTFLKRSQEPGS